VAFVVFVVLVEGGVAEGFVGHEFFLCGIFSGEVEIGVPGAGVEVDLVAAVPSS
jgi:hypothetical protein